MLYIAHKWDLIQFADLGILSLFMTDLTFLKALRDKLKGGNTRSIHLNVLPGRFATRLDVGNLNYINNDLAQNFLSQLFTKSKFEFKISFEGINFQSLATDHQKKLELLAKRLNSLHIENEDSYKEHGIKTFGFGFPILIKQSKKDPKKFIKAPIFIWNLEIVKASNKVNTWSVLKNKTKGERERIVDDEIHSVGLNEVLLSFLKSDEGIDVPQINEEVVEETVVDKTILIEECIKVLQAVNSQNIDKEFLASKLNEQINNIPEGSVLDSTGGANAWIHFGGVFGLFRTQKESIIGDIDKIIERAEEFKFDNLIVEKFTGTPHSAIETDPSQQEILNTLGSIPKKIIQGPPGTGKSQTLTALITNALANNLKCLVVCEKKTALDVIKNNLLREHEQLGALTAIIEDIDKDRKDIVNSVRERMLSLNPSYFQQTNYQLVRQSIEKIVGEINNQHKKLDRSIFHGKSWTHLVGEYLKIQKKLGYSILNNKLDHTQFKFHADENEFPEISNKIKTGKRLFTDAKHLNSLEVLNDEMFKRDSPKAVLLELEFKLKERINEMSKVVEFVDEIEQKDKQLFVREDAITNLKVNFQSIFSPSFKKLKSNKQKFKEVAPTLLQAINQENLYQKKLKFPSSLLETVEASQSILHILKETQNSLGDFIEYYNWRKFYLDLNTLQRNVIIALIQENCDDWESTFESWYYFWILSNNEDKELPKSDDKIRELFQVKAQLKNVQIQNIITNWASKQYISIKRTQARSISPTSLYNKKGGPGQRRNSLRHIIKADFNLFTDFFPVVMMSPSVCSSIMPLKEGLFDIVIFDEASQLRLEDTYPALIRGNVKIVSGDSQQMPPSSYFQGSTAVLHPTEEDYETESELQEIQNSSRNSLDLVESESLLVYAENCGYKQSYLRVHYRSKHPDLIEFSNHAFYGRKLIPMPAKQDYKAIKFVEVNGIYEGQVNREEAQKVINILLEEIQPLSNGKYPSVGIATFNIYQRNLILEEITKARQLKPEYDRKFSDLGSDLFVKNLENIQGDERDIIIISTTFGRKQDGSFRQSFGPILQRNGYKLLNVIVTRAKYKIFVCTSIPQENINQYPNLLRQFQNNGRAIFYAYLAYAKCVSENNIEAKNALLKQLYENCDGISFDNDDSGFGSESPFEDEVYYSIVNIIGKERLEQQYKLGGFRIDLVVKSKKTGKPIIAIECDGAKYHDSNEAYAWDMFRQKQIEQHGIVFHRIWSTNWWYSSKKEITKMLDFIEAVDQKEI